MSASQIDGVTAVFQTHNPGQIEPLVPGIVMSRCRAQTHRVAIVGHDIAVDFDEVDLGRVFDVLDRLGRIDDITAAVRAGRCGSARRSAGRPRWPAAIDDPADRVRRQLLLGQERRRRAFGDRAREIGRRVGRDQDDGRPAVPVLCGQPPGKLKPALTPEHDIHQDNLRPQLLCSPQRLSRGSSHADDAQALPFQAAAGSSVGDRRRPTRPWPAVTQFIDSCR